MSVKRERRGREREEKGERREKSAGLGDEKRRSKSVIMTRVS